MSIKQLGSSKSNDDWKLSLHGPSIKVTVVSLHNLDALEQGALQPYVNLTYSGQTINTKILSEGETYFETCEFETHPLHPLVISLLDKDDYGKDSVISAVAIPHFRYQQWNKQFDLYLKQVPQDATEEEVVKPLEFNDDLVLKDPGDSPCIHLQVMYLDQKTLSQMSVKVLRHFIKSTATETFTQYELEVTRGDGQKWSVQVRYSQVEVLKRAVDKIFPDIAALPFPRKTHLECLSGICSGLSRFNEERISARQKAIEEFLNLVLKKSKFESDQLMDLMQVPTSMRLNSDPYG